jgi:hypothetical protein
MKLIAVTILLLMIQEACHIVLLDCSKSFGRSEFFSDPSLWWNPSQVRESLWWDHRSDIRAVVGSQGQIR